MDTKKKQEQIILAKDRKEKVKTILKNAGI
jgi:hypothetical protein